MEVSVATKEERAALLKAIEEDGPDVLAEADDSLKADREFMLEAVEEDGGALQYADASLKADREFMLKVVKKVGWALESAAKALRADREIVLTAVTNSGHALEYASDSLKADREVVLVAVKQWGNALEYADDSLKADREVVLAAVTNSGALEYADASLKADREIVLIAVTNYLDRTALKYADASLKADREVVLAAVTDNGGALEYADDSLKADREVVLAAVTDNGAALEYASEELQQDKEMGETRDGFSVLSDGSYNVEIPVEPDVQIYVLKLNGFGDWDWYEEDVGMLERLLSGTPVAEDLAVLLDWLKPRYFDLLGNIKEWNPEHFLFVPFKVDGGSIFLREVDFENTDSMTLARDLIERGVDLSYTIEEYELYFVHANFSYLGCFQFRGKRDYLALVSTVNCHYLKVIGRFSETFRIESGELIRIDDIIFQEYEHVGTNSHALGEGWETDKVDEDGNFQAERIVHREYQGKGALSFFAADYEVRNWLDGAYVARNLRTGQ